MLLKDEEAVLLNDRGVAGFLIEIQLPFCVDDINVISEADDLIFILIKKRDGAVFWSFVDEFAVFVDKLGIAGDSAVVFVKVDHIEEVVVWISEKLCARFVKNPGAII